MTFFKLTWGNPDHYEMEKFFYKRILDTAVADIIYFRKVGEKMLNT